TPAPSSVKSPGSALELKTMRRMCEVGWTALSKMDRKRKIKDASTVSEEEMFKNLYKDYPQASQVHSTAPKKSPAPCSVKSPGSALKLKTMRRMCEAGWASFSKMDRKRKIKDAIVKMGKIKDEQEKEETIQLYEELRSNIEVTKLDERNRMTVAFEEIDRLEMSFK
ncbi:hypothetical protein EK904_013196, partial [Melospiza melodia maxima]